MEEDKIIQERKEKAIRFIKERYDWITYFFLAIVVYISFYIRTRPLPGLRDVSTGGWTLGPDLDPFLFLRWARYILEHGSIYAIDPLRYVPLGYNTQGEFFFLPYLIVYFHKVASFLGISSSIEQSASYYPVFFFAITVVAFFFFVREVFADHFEKISANVIAVIASFFLAVIPALLPRTIAGIPEKESTAFFFLFLASYFFLVAWKAKSNARRYIFTILAGLSTAGMTLIWGGSEYLYATIALSVAVAFILGQINKEKFYIYAIWVILSFSIASYYSSRYSLTNILSSVITGTTVGVLFIIAFYLFIFKYFEKYTEKTSLAKIPKPLLSAIISIILLAILGIAFWITFVTGNIRSIISVLVSPSQSRFGVTVAENRQPFFGEWASNFGPALKGAPILFWLFFIGSIHLFYFSTKNILKSSERIIIAVTYTLFLITLIFSRYSPSSILNGTNGTSLFVYALGFIVLLSVGGYYYYQYFKRGEQDKFKEIDMSIILVFLFYFLALVSARGGVRVIMVLVPPSAIMISYFIISVYQYAFHKKDSQMKIFAWALAGIVILSAIYSGYYYYQVSIATAQSYVPSSYTQQWQKAMGWVRDNTPENAVSAHWWDYGYWVQTMGLRATVLDGGNAITYWDYLMGRYALAGKSEAEALEFLYSHNVTHFLIDSTDIGKYSAFSSIGSDKNYDRFSFIPSFTRDQSQTQETKNSTLELYTGGNYLDEDIIFVINGSKIFLPANSAGIAGIILEKDNEGELVGQPTGIFVYQGAQYRIPFRYAFQNGSFIDFKTGIESGIFPIPRMVQDQRGFRIEKANSLLYLSNRTVTSQFARLYLYKEKDPYFKLVHTEDDLLVSQIKQSGADLEGDFVDYQGIRGPIRIWEVSYPKDIKVNPEYLLTYYPDISVTKV